MAAAVPPRPSPFVPRPNRPSAVATARRPPTRSEPRLSLHSVDLEEMAAAEARSDSHQRATLLRPLGEDDPLDVVMSALKGLRCERAVEVATVCLSACVRAVGCRAAIAHLWDPREQSFVIVYALGPNSGVLLNARHDEDDPLLAEAFAKGSPRVVNYEGVRAPLARHALFGGAWSVLVTPVEDEGLLLGAMELVDPLDGSCFDDRGIAATRYASERMKELLSDAISSIGKLIVPSPE